MNIKEIIELAKFHYGDVIDIGDGLRLANEAINQIATFCRTGRVLDETTISNAVKNTWYGLPETLILIEKVTKENEEYEEYEKNNLKIRFENDGTYLIEYKRSPHKVAIESDTPELNEMYHYPIAYYIASRKKYYFNSEDVDAARLYNEFLMMIKEIDNTLSKNRRKITLYAPVWR